MQPRDRNKRAVAWAMEQRQLGIVQHSVLIALARLADKNAIVEVAAPELAEWVGISPKALRKARLALRDAGYYRAGKQVKQGGWVYTLYELNAPGAWAAMDRARAAKARKAEKAEGPRT